MSASRKELHGLLSQVYESMEGSELSQDYSNRHGIESAACLTVFDDDMAAMVAQYLAPRIEGRIVVEIGGGIGLLAFHLGLYAKRVYCIEANPMWSWTFAACLLAQKPKNVSYLFGAASEFAGVVRGDVALFCTHSDAAGMRATGELFAREVIDVYSGLVDQEWNPLREMTRRRTTATVAEKQE